jgi:hypothetical protein
MRFRTDDRDKGDARRAVSVRVVFVCVAHRLKGLRMEPPDRSVQIDQRADPSELKTVPNWIGRHSDDLPAVCVKDEVHVIVQMQMVVLDDAPQRNGQRQVKGLSAVRTHWNATLPPHCTRTCRDACIHTTPHTPHTQQTAAQHTTYHTSFQSAVQSQPSHGIARHSQSAGTVGRSVSQSLTVLFDYFRREIVLFSGCEKPPAIQKAVLSELKGNLFTGLVTDRTGAPLPVRVPTLNVKRFAHFVRCAQAYRQRDGWIHPIRPPHTSAQQRITSQSHEHNRGISIRLAPVRAVGRPFPSAGACIRVVSTAASAVRHSNAMAANNIRPVEAVSLRPACRSDCNISAVERKEAIRH